MKKILFIVIALSVLGGGYWYADQNDLLPMQETPKEEQQSDNKTSDKEKTKDSMFSGGLQKMLGLGESLKCSWKSEDEAMGTTWIKGGNTYTEIATAEGEFYSITKNNCVWTWMGTNSQGMKMCYDTEEEIYTEEGENEEMQEEMQMPETPLQKPPVDVDYNCKKANINDSRFDPPSDIEFISLDDLMEGNIQDLQEKAKDLIPEQF